MFGAGKQHGAIQNFDNYAKLCPNIVYRHIYSCYIHANIILL